MKCCWSHGCGMLFAWAFSRKKKISPSKWINASPTKRVTNDQSGIQSLISFTHKPTYIFFMKTKEREKRKKTITKLFNDQNRFYLLYIIFIIILTCLNNEKLRKNADISDDFLCINTAWASLYGYFRLVSISVIILIML